MKTYTKPRLFVLTDPLSMLPPKINSITVFRRGQAEIEDLGEREANTPRKPPVYFLPDCEGRTQPRAGRVWFRGRATSPERR